MNKNLTNPDCLYKYTKKVYALAMLSGEFYINTLENLRQYEELHSEIGDKDEGTKNIYADKVNFDTSQPETLHDVPEFAKNMVQGPGIKIVNGTFIQKTMENFYIFSCSKIYNIEIMKKFGYDACIEISEPNKFFQEITNTMKTMNLTNYDFFCGECNYQILRDEHYKKASLAHPAIIKPARYAYQQEVRVIWIPKESKVNPEKITSKEAGKYIKILV